MNFLLINILKDIYRYFRYRNYREFYNLYSKYANKQRFVYKKDVKFLDYKVDVPDLPSFVWQYKELFLEEIYRFNSDKSDPVIIDCGANIGLSCIYFKRLFPSAIVKAFEADPKILRVLEKNIQEQNLKDIEIIGKAVWINDNGIEFFSEGADGGSIEGEGEKINISSIRLKDYLDDFNVVDLLKIDIEGAEYEVLLDLTENLYKVKNIFIEYHSWNKNSQKLSEILSVLELYGFRYYIEGLNKRKSPLINYGYDNPMDLQLNIFGYRN